MPPKKPPPKDDKKKQPPKDLKDDKKKKKNPKDTKSKMQLPEVMRDARIGIGRIGSMMAFAGAVPDTL